MGFFNFFKRDISEEEFQEQQKVKRGLEKTRTGFFQSIVNTLTNAQIDDDLYDQLEEQLILADVGPACAVRLVDELHDEVKEKHLKTGQGGAGRAARHHLPGADPPLPDGSGRQARRHSGHRRQRRRQDHAVQTHVGLLRPREGRCVIDRRRVPSMRDVFR